MRFSPTKRPTLKRFNSSAQITQNSNAWKPNWTKNLTSATKSLKLNKIASIGSHELPRLRPDLERVLFRSGAHAVGGGMTFDERWRHIPDISTVNWSAFPGFVPPSKDSALLDLTTKCNDTQRDSIKFYGSTSSLSGPISHIIIALARLKKFNDEHLSHAIKTGLASTFTRRSRLPIAIKLAHKPGDVYSIDAYKDESDQSTILSELGHVLERFLTIPEPTFSNQYLLSENASPAVEQNCFVFSKIGNVGVRAQLDCHHPKLENKVFDVKTRAAMPLRYDLEHYKQHTQYRITKLRGLFESFEREYVDMIRSTFLKYALQVRMGHMDGIFVAYHNTKEMFGFQYIPLRELETRIFGSAAVAETWFGHAFHVFSALLEVAVKDSPGQDLFVTLYQQQDKLSIVVANELNVAQHVYSVQFKDPSANRNLAYTIQNVTPDAAALADYYAQLRKKMNAKRRGRTQPGMMFLYDKPEKRKGTRI